MRPSTCSSVQRELNAAQTPEDEFYNVVGYKIADQQSYDQMYQRYYSDKILEISNMSGTLWSDPGVSTIAYEIISGISTPGAAISKYETSIGADGSVERHAHHRIILKQKEGELL